VRAGPGRRAVRVGGGESSVLPSPVVDERLARRPDAIRGMFAAVAPRYDLLNRLLSLRQDVRWRRRLVAALAAAPAGPVLDLATGTGDVAFAVEGREVVGADFCVDMLALARDKAQRHGRDADWAAADGLALPFRSGAFAAVTIAFGIRNFADLGAGLAEIRRVLLPGGVLAVLEFQRPTRRSTRLGMALWNRLVVAPVGAALSGDPAAYSYLPASVATFPDAAALAGAMREAGLSVESSRELSGGIVALTVAREPVREGP
jgi:demethylmenaquinone methyltransferase/2-methoxy-6-polyprenyl-1,4-benzoquinol methylase